MPQRPNANASPFISPSRSREGAKPLRLQRRVASLEDGGEGYSPRFSSAIQFAQPNRATASPKPNRHPGLVPGSTATQAARYRLQVQSAQPGGSRHKAGMTEMQNGG